MAWEPVTSVKTNSVNKRARNEANAASGEKLSLFVDKKLLMPLQLWATVFFVRVIICFLTMTQENIYIIFLYMYIIVLTFRTTEAPL